LPNCFNAISVILKIIINTVKEPIFE